MNDRFTPDYYYQVELLDGTTGWVHGGGLNALNTEQTQTLESFQIK